MQLQNGLFDVEELKGLIVIEPRGDGDHLCKNCGEMVTAITKIEPDTSPHYARAACGRCGRWIKWIPKPEV